MKPSVILNYASYTVGHGFSSQHGVWLFLQSFSVVYFRSSMKMMEN